MKVALINNFYRVAVVVSEQLAKESDVSKYDSSFLPILITSIIIIGILLFAVWHLIRSKHMF